MVDAHLYCAQLNSIGFLIFAVAVLVITSWPAGGHKQRLTRRFGPLLGASM